MSSFLWMVAVALLIICFFMKMNYLQKEMGNLIKIVGTIKFKQFEHEIQLLNRAGVYIPEDSAEFVYNILWSTINEEDKQFLKEEYNRKCPKHIPMWKFVLYTYRVSTKVIQKEPLMDISNTEKIMNGLQQVNEVIKATEKITREMDNLCAKMEDSITDTDNNIENIENQKEKVGA